ncbi:Phage late control gene D protein (GPD) (plasmid) [Streptomyces sp. YIM 121038]|uniref:VgrG-related protein n=1 Tax=Streptomyces sp. YIM 121038 TaxID=2136401 RepID=UPI0011626FE5|nr:VgrG-related protein [Streptomyces sp. YIM 121038]QCX82326.1 Phage late control gene D protein (GPD) [Streptomyces sp. YIM 121038]
MGTNDDWYAAEPVVQLAGKEVPREWAGAVVETLVETSVAQPARACVRFHDPDRTMLAKLNVSIGARLVVHAALDGRRRQLFAGEVTELQTQLTSDTSQTFAVVWGMDGGHRLQRGRQVRAYSNASLEKIVREAAARAGLVCGDVHGARETIPYLAQPNMTDWELLQHLAVERGLRVSVEGKQGTVLHLRRAAPETGRPRVILRRGDNLLSVTAALTSAGQVDTVEVRGWDVTHKKPLSSETVKTEKSDRVRIGLSPADACRPFRRAGGARLLVAGRPYAVKAEAKTAAQALAADCAAGFAGLQAVAKGNPGLQAGQWITVAGVGAPFTGDYTISSSRHSFASGQGARTTYTTHVLVDRAPAGPVPAPAPLSAQGVAIGLVTKVKKEDSKEKDDNKEGWVRLKLPWLDESYETDWVRSVQFGGVGGGGVVPVEVGDEVLVAFEHGRLDRPYVLGGLYNGKDHPSDHDGVQLFGPEGKANRRSLASRAGDRIELLTPADGPQGIRLVTGLTSDKGDEKAQRLSLLLDRSAHAIALSAGTDDKAVSLQLDCAGQFAALGAGTDKDQAQICLDQKNKKLTLGTGTGTNAVNLTLNHDTQTLTLAAGTDNNQAQICLDQKNKKLTLGTGTGTNAVNLTLNHDTQTLTLAAGTDNNQAQICLDQKNKKLTLGTGTGTNAVNLTLNHDTQTLTLAAGTDNNQAQICLDQKNKKLTLNGGAAGTLELAANNINITATEKLTLQGKNVDIN